MSMINHATIQQIATARLLAKQRGHATHDQLIRALVLGMRKAGADLNYSGLTSHDATPAVARIDWGRWVADCPTCGGVEAVDPEERIFYCFHCGNDEIDGAARPVAFPDWETLRAIEKLLLKRPVRLVHASSLYDRITAARPVIAVDLSGVRVPLSRSWDANQTLDDLHREQDDAIAAWQKAQTEEAD